MIEAKTVYDLAGGEPTFRLLVDRFYDAVERDQVLLRVYPPDTLAEARENLALFLIQYWGGPGTYSDRRGHPRLRMRHAPFAIGERERAAWLGHMNDAVLSLRLPEVLQTRLLDYFENAAAAMVNA
ncbi:MAG TPA: globin [Solirubrobacterales bacterium]|nr:globin [Solirubrobacterales bacterium]